MNESLIAVVEVVEVIIKNYLNLSAIKNVRQKFFTVRKIEIWNSLSYEVVNAPTVNTFKNRLDRHGYTTLFRQTLFWQTLFRQSMHSLDVGWLTAVE